MHHIIRLALALIFVSCLFGSAHSTCYLNSTGLSINNCTVDFPCASVTDCLKQISPNDTALTISFASGLYGTENCGISLYDGIGSLVNLASISIEGNASNPTSAIIDCGSKLNHFQVLKTNATVSFSYLSFRNGYSQNLAGCIYAYNVKSLVVKNAEFINCNSTSGGAIYSQYSTLTVLNSNFTSNTAGTGGAMWLQPSGNGTSIINCVVQYNTAKDGAGIYLVGDYLTLTNSDISHNHASGDGAGLYLTSLAPTTVGVYNFQGTNISSNAADSRGAGLFSQNLDHAWNVFGANFASNNALINSVDSNIACNSTDSPFCAACKAADCTSDCLANDARSCSLTVKGDALCYKSSGTCKSSNCKCKNPLSTIAKMLLVMICVCLIVGTALILIGVVRFILKRRSNKNSYTPIK